MGLKLSFSFSSFSFFIFSFSFSSFLLFSLSLSSLSRDRDLDLLFFFYKKIFLCILFLKEHFKSAMWQFSGFLRKNRNFKENNISFPNLLRQEKGLSKNLCFPCINPEISCLGFLISYQIKTFTTWVIKTKQSQKQTENTH